MFRSRLYHSKSIWFSLKHDTFSSSQTVCQRFRHIFFSRDFYLCYAVFLVSRDANILLHLNILSSTAGSGPDGDGVDDGGKTAADLYFVCSQHKLYRLSSNQNICICIYTPCSLSPILRTPPLCPRFITNIYIKICIDDVCCRCSFVRAVAVTVSARSSKSYQTFTISRTVNTWSTNTKNQRSNRMWTHKNPYNSM